MTDDHDELASAFLDREASPAEAAQVEGAADLRAQVEAFRVVAERLSTELPRPDPAVRRRHLAVALEAFDAGPSQAATTEPGGASPAAGGVVDLGHRRERRRLRLPPAPAWLGAAAVLAVIAGGIGWLATQERSDADETASVAADGVEETGETTALAAEESAAGAATDADDEATEELADSAAAEEAEQPAEADVARDDADTDTGESGADPSTTSIAGGGFFPDETIEAARRHFDVVPTDDEQAELAAGELLDPDLSACGASFEPPGGEQLIGFVPVAVAGENGELLVYEPGGGGEAITAIVDGECQPLFR